MSKQGEMMRSLTELAGKRCAEIALQYADENCDGRKLRDAHLAAWLNLAGKIIAERIRNEFVSVGAWPSIDARLTLSKGKSNKRRKA